MGDRRSVEGGRERVGSGRKIETNFATMQNYATVKRLSVLIKTTLHNVQE